MVHAAVVTTIGGALEGSLEFGAGSQFGIGVRSLGSRAWGLRLGVWGLGFGVWSSGFGVRDSDFCILNSVLCPLMIVSIVPFLRLGAHDIINPLQYLRS